MSRQARRALALVIAVAALAALAVLLAPPREEIAPSPTAAPEKAFGAGTVRSVAIENALDSYEVSEGSVTGVPADILDAERMGELLKQFDGLKPAKTVDAPAKDLSIYGLEPAAATVAVTYEGGEALKFLIGDRERVSGNYYFRLDGESAVYLMHSGQAERLLGSREDWIMSLVTPYCRAASALGAVTDIEFKRPDGEIAIRSCANPTEDMKREMLSFGAVTHVLEGPVLHELDRTYALSVFESLFGMQATEIVAYGLDDGGMAAYGLDRPDMVVSFGMKNGDLPDTPIEQWELRAVDGGSGTALVSTGSGAVYRVSRPAFLDARYEKLASRWFFSPLLADLKALVIEADGRTYAYGLSGTASALAVSKDGRALDPARFREFYSLIVSAASDGEYLGLSAPAGEPVLAVRYSYLDPAKPDDVLALYPTGGRTLLASKNGAAEFAVREKYASAVRAAMAALDRGEPIAQTW
ncbi:MAG: DUF4340 domain-containing protein [Clostridiales bacterium]|nr:DUF4340 domain-containing protein [Clostridiales bacterium]